MEPLTVVEWDDEGPAVVLLDQRALPGTVEHVRATTVAELGGAVRELAVRGAPCLGLAGVYGVALAAFRHGDDHDAVRRESGWLAGVRPTAVPLRLGVERALRRLGDGRDAVLAEAHAAAAEGAMVNAAATTRAADLVEELTTGRRVRTLTLCNTGDLATGPGGSALGAIRRLHERGVLAETLACETRPLLQGARLTVWELDRARVPHRLCVDSAGPAAIAAGLVDAVLVGADRIAANGDVANKIGTYMLACAAQRSGVPFLVVAPEETIDPHTATGADIPIEERAAAEVTALAGVATTVPGTAVYNPAFDVTPFELVTAVVTEKRAWRPADRRRRTGARRRRPARP